MKVINILKGSLLATLLSVYANADVIDNANVISKELAIKLNEIGDELKSKTNVRLDLLTLKNLQNFEIDKIKNSDIEKNNTYILDGHKYLKGSLLKNQSLKNAVEPYLESLKKPYIVLVLVPKSTNGESGKVDIFASKDAYLLFDKESILSPYPEKGTIIPILVSQNKGDIYGAAMLNGYADIADQVADKKGVKLETSIGNSNRIVINILRYIVYASIIFAIIIFIRRKIKSK